MTIYHKWFCDSTRDLYDNLREVDPRCQMPLQEPKQLKIDEIYPRYWSGMYCVVIPIHAGPRRIERPPEDSEAKFSGGCGAQP